MKTLLNKWFLIGCFSWLIVLTARKAGHPIPYLNGYLGDAFAVPVIANISLWFQRVLIIRNNYYVLAIWHVAFIFSYLTILFEAILPHFSKLYTADLFDVLLYLIGSLFFYFVMNKPANII